MNGGSSMLRIFALGDECVCAKPPLCIPSPEICNGIDDNCDDIIDDGCSIDPAPTNASHGTDVMTEVSALYINKLKGAV